MKKLLAYLLLITAATFTSCRKEELPAPAPAGNTQAEVMHVEYKVRAVSGKFSVEYLAPGIDNKLELKKENYDRNEISFAFDCARGQQLSVKAFNAAPSSEEVVVELYINNVLVKFASANAPGASALVEATY